MSQLGQFRQYAEERDSPRRRVSIPWKFLSASPKAPNEYHLIDLAAGVSHGGFDTLGRGSPNRPRRRSIGLGHLPWQCAG